MNKDLLLKSGSPKETRDYAASFARDIVKKGKKRGHAFALGLRGELGAGKTTFVQGFALGLGVKKGVLSPTFVLMKRFSLKGDGFKFFCHIDLYRLRGDDEAVGPDLKKVLADSSNIAAVEWPDGISGFMPEDTVWIDFQHGEKEHERVVTVRGQKPGVS